MILRPSSLKRFSDFLVASGAEERRNPTKSPLEIGSNSLVIHVPTRGSVPPPPSFSILFTERPYWTVCVKENARWFRPVNFFENPNIQNTITYSTLTFVASWRRKEKTKIVRRLFSAASGLFLGRILVVNTCLPNVPEPNFKSRIGPWCRVQVVLLNL